MAKPNKYQPPTNMPVKTPLHEVVDQAERILAKYLKLTLIGKTDEQLYEAAKPELQEFAEKQGYRFELIEQEMLQRADQTAKEKLYTVEWDNDYPEFKITANWCVTRTLVDAFKITNKLRQTMLPVSPEEVAKLEGITVEEAKEAMLPVWCNANDTVRITEYTLKSAGPMKWKMLKNWLAAYKM